MGESGEGGRFGVKMEDTVPVRLRLQFDGRHLLRKRQRLSGLKRSWILLRPGLLTVSDVASHIVDSFNIRLSCPDGVLLSMDDFVLPEFESTRIFKDEDVVMVQKKGHKHREVIKNSDNVNRLNLIEEDADIVNRHPLILCDKVLPEFERESGGHQSEEECDSGYHHGGLNDSRGNLPRIASLKRKGNQADDLQSSKRKKSKVSIPKKPTSTSTEVNGVDQIERIYECSSGKEYKHEKYKPKKKGKPSNDDNGTAENKAASRLVESRHNLTQEGLEGDGSKHNADGASKKFPSRSARRKKAKRLWLQKHANSEKEKLVQNHLPENNDHQKSTECDAAIQRIASADGTFRIVVKPGHIQFETLEPTKQLISDQVTLQWNGTTSKKKGQKWGRDDRNFSRRITNKINRHAQYNEKNNAEELEAANGCTEFKRIAPLTRSPMEGDVVFYQLLECSPSSRCPEISSDKVGKVASFDRNSTNAVLVPVSGYPMPKDKASEEEIEPIPCLYNEDGSLEVEFTSLINVRVLITDENNDATIPTKPDLKPTDSPSPWDVFAEKRKKKNNIWDVVSQVLPKKKANLTGLQKKGWSNWPSSSTTYWNFKAPR